MIIIQKADVILADDQRTLIADASQLGLAPEIAPPNWITVVDEKGEGFLFGFPNPNIVDGELRYTHYHSQPSGFFLTLFND